MLIQEEVAKEFGVPVQLQRFWIWAKRQNHTYRPNRPLTPQEELQPVILSFFMLFMHVVCLFLLDIRFYIEVILELL